MLAKQIVQKCKKIKIIISDVDGVLTDGGMYYSEKGEVLKKFNTRDGMAIKLLENGIKTILITGENSKIVKARAKKIKASSVFIGISKKELLLPKICKKYNVSNSEIAYIGDDLNDYKIMKKVGFSATPSDGIAEIKLVSDYVCKIKGGHGAFREFCDLILNYQK
tara:strand:- start:104 stop:598 length:495 start_codon:yes stop_codon:yes gene_type:complete